MKSELNQHEAVCGLMFGHGVRCFRLNSLSICSTTTTPIKKKFQHTGTSVMHLDCYLVIVTSQDSLTS